MQALLDKTDKKETRIESSAFETNFQDLIRKAAAENASDLHIDPMDHAIRIRIRVDGTLRILQSIHGQSYTARFFQQTKRACGFDMGKIGIPQDRRLHADVVPFDLRANLIPTLYGEKIVLRLLQRGKKFSLETYDMPAAAKAALRRATGREQGLILMSGPTGSGKTTLLYSALSEIDAVGNNVHTLEDPVEYELPGIIQSSIAPGDMSYGAALRALMRQDPDVIMVGEIRDDETARAAIHAASTGHLVFSSIHANSAAESVGRLGDLGMTEEQVMSNLLFSSAQRLVPRNCPDCAEPDVEGKKIVCQVFREDMTPLVSYGCQACGGTGVKGRVLLFEYLTFEAVAATGKRVAHPHGSLKTHALDYLRKGVINVHQAYTFE